MHFLLWMSPCHSAFMKRAHLRSFQIMQQEPCWPGYSVPPGLKDTWYRDVFIFLVPTWYRSTGSFDNTTYEQAQACMIWCRLVNAYPAGDLMILEIKESGVDIHTLNVFYPAAQTIECYCYIKMCYTYFNVWYLNTCLQSASTPFELRLRQPVWSPLCRALYPEHPQTETCV